MVNVLSVLCPDLLQPELSIASASSIMQVAVKSLRILIGHLVVKKGLV